MASYDSLLKVTNNSSDKRYMFAANSQRWLLGPGQTNFIPFDAVIRSMGDPRSGPQPIRITGQGGRATVIPSRREEIARLHVLYGTYGEGVDTVNAEGDRLIDAIPDITAWNMGDDETPITFPCSDPDCTNLSTDDQDQSQQAVLMREMEKMRRQMAVYDEMMRQAGLAGTPGLPESQTPKEEIDEDSPTPVRATVPQKQQRVG